MFELVKLRASQINGCAYCIDMHHKDLRAGGETEDRLYMLPAWREATVYTEAERAALALTEAVTLIAGSHVPEDVEAEARRVFDTESYAALVFAIALINTWNRLAITAHSEPGHYRPRPRAAARLTGSERVGEALDVADRRRGNLGHRAAKMQSPAWHVPFTVRLDDRDAGVGQPAGSRRGPRRAADRAG